MSSAAAWMIWATTVMIVSSTTRNPLYILELLMVVLLVDAATARADDAGPLFSVPRFAVIAVSAAAVFNALTVHLGGTVIFCIPEGIPLLGGIVTLEGVLYGALNGLLLTVIYAGFGVMSRRTHTHDLVRLVPRAFHQLGVVLAIAMTYLPQTRQNLERIREAQSIRGVRLQRLRDWVPVVVPLLVGGLERSMGLAEAMVARGYASGNSRDHEGFYSLWLVVSMVLLLIGWLGQLLSGSVWFTGLLVLGGLLFVLLVVVRGRSVKATAFRANRLSTGDWAVMAGCALALVAVFAGGEQAQTLGYSPYPTVTLPVFGIWIGVALAALAVPAFVPLVARDDGRNEVQE